MTTSDRSRQDAAEEEEAVDPTADDSVLADAPDTTTGKEHLRQNDEGRPGPAV